MFLYSVTACLAMGCLCTDTGPAHHHAIAFILCINHCGIVYAFNFGLFRCLVASRRVFFSMLFCSSSVRSTPV